VDRTLVSALCTFLLAASVPNWSRGAQAQDQSAASAHEHMNHRGDQVMGFSHEKTTHHFRLYVDGGAIEVSANDPKDTTSRDEIRAHLAHIARRFAAGDFEAPMLIHGQTPPGEPTLKRLRSAVTYKFEPMDNGGRVRISTSNAEALKAVHDFLRFQIAEHQTGDPLQISSPAR
jgi:hypothetical protein